MDNLKKFVDYATSEDRINKIEKFVDYMFSINGMFAIEQNLKFELPDCTICISSHERRHFEV